MSNIMKNMLSGGVTLLLAVLDYGAECTASALPLGHLQLETISPRDLIFSHEIVLQIK